MKAVILNDTSIERHHGCSRVMDHIYDELARNGVEVVANSYLNADLQSIELMGQINRCDIVIINGEGTIHHGRQYAEEMLQLVAASSAKIKVLFNATYDSNPLHYREYLHAFDYIFVRDRRSRDELSKIAVSANVVPDLTFLSEPCARGRPVNHLLISDSVDREVVIELHSIGIEIGNNARPISIFEPPRNFLDRLWHIRMSLAKTDLRSPTMMIKIARARNWFVSSSCRTHHEFASQIANSDFLLTGRYHAVCMAIKNKTPFLAVDSNTFKIRALLEDVGLTNRCIRKGELLESDRRDFLPFSPVELDLIEEFNQRAKKSIQSMFSQILSHG